MQATYMSTGNSVEKPQRGNGLEKRHRPIELRPKFRLGKSLVTDGVLTIYPRAGSLRHPIGGHFYIGADAHPFTGHVEGLCITNEPSAPPGRPPKTARDVGVTIAYSSFLQAAQRSVRTTEAQKFAKEKCLELWKRWPGIQDQRALRAARKRTRDMLTGDLFTYSGTEEDFSDYVAILLLTNATWQILSGELVMQGPAWIWRWGSEEAVYSDNISATAKTPGAKDSALVTVGGQ